MARDRPHGAWCETSEYRYSRIPAPTNGQPTRRKHRKARGCVQGNVSICTVRPATTSIPDQRIRRSIDVVVIRLSPLASRRSRLSGCPRRELCRGNGWTCTRVDSTLQVPACPEPYGVMKLLRRTALPHGNASIRGCCRVYRAIFFQGSAVAAKAKG